MMPLLCASNLSSEDMIKLHTRGSLPWPGYHLSNRKSERPVSCSYSKAILVEVVLSEQGVTR